MTQALRQVEYRCSDGCGTSATVPADEFPVGWTYLNITKRWRCPSCTRQLKAVNCEPDQIRRPEETGCCESDVHQAQGCAGSETALTQTGVSVGWLETAQSAQALSIVRDRFIKAVQELDAVILELLRTAK